MEMKIKFASDSATWGQARMVVAVLVCILLLNMTAFGGSGNGNGNAYGRLAKDLDVASTQTVDVIVQYANAPTTTNLTKAQGRGALMKAQLDMINSAVFSIPADQVPGWLDDDPDISYVSPDRALDGNGAVADSSATLDYYPLAINAQIGWNMGLNGTGIGVAVIDSGIFNLLDLQNSAKKTRIVYNQDFTGIKSTLDQYGHGTHVAGIIGGSGASSTGSSYKYTFKGIAPNVNFVNLRVLDANGRGTDSAVIAAIDRAIALKATYNIRVINLSLGRPVYESYTIDPLCQAVEKAWKAGIVVVVSAGNEGRNNSASTNGYGTITAPANDPYVITVGAMKTMGTSDRGDDQIATYSSKGPTLYDHVVKPDLVAPGNRIISLYTTTLTLNKLYPANEIPQSLYYVKGSLTPSTAYYRLSGTSMAAPMVSGTVALMLQKTPSLTPDQVKARLMKTAYKTLPLYTSAVDPVTGVSYNTQSDIFTVGAGYLDVQAALQSTDLAPATAGSAMSPPVAVDSNGDVYIVTNSSVIWGSSVMWGSSLVWGSSVIWGSNVSGQSVLWGSSVCWGSNTTQGYSVLWGSSVVWGSSANVNTEATLVTINGEN